MLNETVVQDFMVAILGSFAGTGLMTGMMLFGRQFGLPAVDAHGILGYVLHAEHANPIGYIMHWVMGAVFAVGYALAFQYIPMNVFVLGALTGVIHWVAVGWMFAFAPLVHAGMKAGTVPQTGAYMLKSLGMVGFFAGMVGHIVFGLTIAAVYVALGGTVALL